MTFQSYKMKYQGSSHVNGISSSSYLYGSTSIVSTIQDGIHTISMAVHGKGKELPYDVKCGIVRHLGINLDLPVEESTVQHPFDPDLGDTHYFSQRMEDSTFGEKQFLNDLKKDSDDIPDSLYLAVSLQAVANNMSREDYVANLRGILDAAFGAGDRIIDDAETAQHIEKIRAAFKKKPTLWQYFIWMLHQSERAS